MSIRIGNIILKRGVTRCVILIGKFAIKIPNFTHSWFHFLKGLVGNINEKQTWRWNSGKYEKGTSHLLCPVIWCSWGGWLLVMRRAKLLSSEEWDAMPYYTDQHREYFIGDDTISNYGVLDDRLVKLDYGELDKHWGEDFKPKKGK